MAVDAALQYFSHFSARRTAGVGLPMYKTLPKRAPQMSGEAQPSEDERESYPASSSASPYADVPSSPRHARTWPSLRTFLADFTLGFADGLTVPFALTAGLSSLGKTSTVIYAGMAEICAGSISMGIGGYLAARGEARVASREGRGGAAGGTGSEDEANLLPSDCEDPEKRDDGGVEVTGAGNEAETLAIARYLAPLRLPPDLESTVLAHLRWHGHDRGAIAETLPTRGEEEPRSSPVLAGLSVSSGYLVGGVIPLFPYFFVAEVGTGLFWSFLVCIIALFTFGFGKEFVLSDNSGRVIDKRSIPWSKIRCSAWEGLQMVVLGGTAAVAAVLCVRIFEGVL
ncbi:putative vacuolar iron transporter protein [Achaetomium macrosporum]|uniref:Vacuolar iron transporter protein n=1 Tax=Achaetomium macrosporum TaxID=79813 RepID=A0AAN7C431_9PEZI|nr:putative vacuolar iron transporter protein [Achaetomium macrosporum]